jgi:putative ABC transport system permease protein
MMAPRAVVRLGIRSLLLHKLRSGLSILGVVFGVAAVVAMSSVGEGARREAVSQIGSLGIDTVTVRARQGTTPGEAGLRLRDAQALADVVPGVVAVAPVREAPLEVTQGSRRAAAMVVGTGPAYARAARLETTSGRFLADLDLQDRKRVAVLGAGVARALFPFGDSRGERVFVAGDYYQVVGVLAGRARPGGKAAPIRTRDVDQSVFIPLASLDRGHDPRPDGIDELVLRVDDPERVAAGAEVVRSLLRRRTGGEGFEVIVPREILRQKERTQRIFNVVTGAIAAISLLVGGIGIMNIMLASVAERTPEVGVRRAVGATEGDIAAQFLTESALLTVVGGIAGAVLGILGSFLIQRFAGWPTALSPLLLLVALLMALAVGIGFGLYPAREAARLPPMVALRHE